MTPWIQTWMGLAVDLANPSPEMIDICDIAHHLANVNRYTGATFRPYSVAEHSVRVALEASDNGLDRRLALWGLLHDASEAYLGDVSSPLKSLLPEYKALERKMMAVVCEKFRLDPAMPEEVRHADMVLLTTEKRDLLGPEPQPWIPMPPPQAETIEPVKWQRAELDFLDLFNHLTGGAHK